MAPKWVPTDPDDLIKRYQAGESLNSLTKRAGVTRPPLTKWLREQGVGTRSLADANRCMAAERTPEQHAANAAAAHEAVRGKRQSVEHRTRIAQTREARVIGASPAELLISEWLHDLQPVPQRAIGPYNVDLAVGSIAVEIFGGSWHAHGRHAARTPQRARYILDAGWTLVVVWVAGRHRLKRDVANYVRALHELAGTDPSLQGQYRVIWGDGKDVTASCPNLDHIALVPTGRSREHRRS